MSGPVATTEVAMGPSLVLENVLVELVSADSMGSKLAVVVRVAPDDVASLVQASRAGVIDLVSVPALSQSLSSGIAS
jgi:FixJ family two-component response regulator